MEIKLKKWGNSQGIILPKKVLHEAGIDLDIPQKFEVQVKNDQLILTPVKPKQSLKDLFRGFDYKKYWQEYDKTHQTKEADFGKPQGREIF